MMLISISIGSSFYIDYFNDSIAIGALLAMTHGILTSTSAGNWGNGTTGLLNNYSPWALTFAATTIDRKFVTKVHLGDKEVYVVWRQSNLDIVCLIISVFDVKDAVYIWNKFDDVLSIGK